MLVQAASGLEKLMAGSKGEVLKDSMVAQISAYVYYNAHVIAKLTENAAFKNKFKEVIFNQIDKDF
jgi:indole-3-glycerol phosphate synthase